MNPRENNYAFIPLEMTPRDSAALIAASGTAHTGRTILRKFLTGFIDSQNINLAVRERG